MDGNYTGGKQDNNDVLFGALGAVVGAGIIFVLAGFLYNKRRNKHANTSSGAKMMLKSLL